MPPLERPSCRRQFGQRLVQGPGLRDFAVFLLPIVPGFLVRILSCTNKVSRLAAFLFEPDFL